MVSKSEANIVSHTFPHQWCNVGGYSLSSFGYGVLQPK